MRFLLYNIKYGTNNLGRWSWLTFLFSSKRHFMNLERFVTAVEADVLGLVEIDGGSYRSGGHSQADKLRSLGYTPVIRSKYPSESLSSTLPVLNKQANAILSRLPIMTARYHDFSVGMKRLVLEVELEEVTFFLVHLALSAKKRHRQLQELFVIIRNTTKPCIVAGDFNFFSGSWESHLFMEAAGLQEANVDHRPTFPSWAPTRQLDYIFHSPEIHITRLRIPRILVSDHLPLVCDFIIDPPTPPSPTSN